MDHQDVYDEVHRNLNAAFAGCFSVVADGFGEGFYVECSTLPGYVARVLVYSHDAVLIHRAHVIDGSGKVQTDPARLVVALGTLFSRWQRDSDLRQAISQLPPE